MQETLLANQPLPTLCSKPCNYCCNPGQGLLLHSTALDVVGAGSAAASPFMLCIAVWGVLFSQFWDSDSGACAGPWAIRSNSNLHQYPETLLCFTSMASVMSTGGDSVTSTAVFCQLLWILKQSFKNRRRGRDVGRGSGSPKGMGGCLLQVCMSTRSESGSFPDTGLSSLACSCPHPLLAELPLHQGPRSVSHPAKRKSSPTTYQWAFGVVCTPPGKGGEEM